jgi:mannose-6-phosphate isomerase-like protein (cupin superfamily)
VPNPARYAKYTFHGYSGYVITPPHAAHELVSVRHSALVSPWVDADVHLHTGSEEYYLLLGGELRILVAGSLLNLKPMEILMVKPHVAHAIVGGEGSIEHLGLRAPALGDRQVTGDIPSELPSMGQKDERELRCDWGYRIPLQDGLNQNCWLIGYGVARFQSSHLILACLDYPTFEEANKGLGTRHRLHLHQRSWEYYIILEGTKTLRIEDALVTLSAGEMLEVPSGVRHALHSRQAPFRGLTFRVPIPEQDDKVEYRSQGEMYS